MLGERRSKELHSHPAATQSSQPASQPQQIQWHQVRQLLPSITRYSYPASFNPRSTSRSAVSLIRFSSTAAHSALCVSWVVPAAWSWQQRHQAPADSLSAPKQFLQGRKWEGFGPATLVNYMHGRPSSPSDQLTTC